MHFAKFEVTINLYNDILYCKIAFSLFSYIFYKHQIMLKDRNLNKWRYLKFIFINNINNKLYFLE